MTRRAIATTCLAVVAASASCNGKPTRAECDAAIDHYVDLVVAEEPDLASLKGAELKAAKDMKRELRLGQPAFRKVHDRCVTDVKSGEVSCAAGAASVKEWESCISP